MNAVSIINEKKTICESSKPGTAAHQILELYIIADVPFCRNMLHVKHKKTSPVRRGFIS
ncbi:hypothetical protein BAXH7_03950 [Bacillus amyloliquefaciens XH7]|nr:hypothetical protein BAXH7_03950 [Bacillus amyloliquefaciens XH7]